MCRSSYAMCSVLFVVQEIDRKTAYWLRSDVQAILHCSRCRGANPIPPSVPPTRSTIPSTVRSHALANLVQGNATLPLHFSQPQIHHHLPRRISSGRNAPREAVRPTSLYIRRHVDRGGTREGEWAFGQLAIDLDNPVPWSSSCGGFIAGYV